MDVDCDYLNADAGFAWAMSTTFRKKGVNIDIDF